MSNTLKSPPGPRLTRKGVLIGSAAALVLVVGVVALQQGGHADAKDTAAPPPPNVTVSAPLQRQVAEWDDYVGRFEASQAVEIRPRVAGALVAIHFRDGDAVQKGQLLFTVDPRPYQAALAQAQARAGQAKTGLTLARADLARGTRLVADQAISAEEIDSLKARVDTAAAAVAGAEADVRARALDVEFTQVRSPISGRVSDRRVDIGNLVASGQAGAATLLTTVYALDPIYFSFEGSEALYLKAKRASGAGPLQAQIRLQDETDYRWTGQVDFTNNGIDPGAGTIRSRAVVRNAGAFLTPGMFGNMRMGTGQPVNALLVPDTAIQQDQARRTVLVVGKDGLVAARSVELGPVLQGLRVIRSGLAPTDRVIIQGIQAAAPGSKVTVRQGVIAAGAGAGEATAAPRPIAAQATIVAQR